MLKIKTLIFVLIALVIATGCSANTASEQSPQEPLFLWPTEDASATVTVYKNHAGKGIDFVPGDDAGAAIFASANGIVARAEQGDTGYGNYIVIEHEDGYETLYAHLETIDVAAGDNVTAGDTIAKMGQTGWATKAHLHFEIHKDGQHLPPLDYIEADTVIQQD